MKKKRLGRKVISYVLALVVVLSTLSGIMPKTSATVFAAEHVDHDDVTFNAWDSDNGLPTVAGNYYLTQDVTISSTWNVPGETKLCLNGHSITLNADSGTVVNIGDGATLNLYDCGVSTYYYTLVDGLASGITNEDKSADDNYESFTGGYITGGKESGVLIDGGIFNMYGGTIIGNMAEQYGGGVNVKSNGTFNMHSGRILGNKAGQSEGAYFNNYGRGGGVCVDGTFNMQGGLIANNTASQPDIVGSKGGGVCCEDGTFVMSSGKIEQNWATFGGGVYVNWRVTVCGDAEITNNRSKTLAGGLYIQAYGQLTISGSVKITDNKNGVFDNNVVDNNVYIAKEAAPIEIDDVLSDTSSIGVRMEAPGVFTYGGSFESKEAAQAVFSSDDSDYEVIAENGEAKLKNAPLKYIQRSWNGSTVTETEKSVEDYNVIHDTYSQEDYLTGWYVVKGNVTFGPRIEMSGEVNLILCDGATLTAPMGIEVKEENTLNIYGQSGDTGTLIATGRGYTYWSTYPSAGIGVGFPSSGNAGIVNIHGGRVIATGATINDNDVDVAGGAGIGGCGNRDSNEDRDSYNGGTVNIYGGDVTATGGAYAAGIGGGGNYGYAYATSGAGVNIYGGTVTTIGGENAVGIGGGSYRDGEEFSEHGSLELGVGMHLYGNATTEHPENDANNHKEKIYGDYERTRYMTINNVAPHSHRFTYSSEDATITATCGNLDGGHSGEVSSTLTIVAPTLTTYGGTGSAEATITGSIDGVTNPDIVYMSGDTVLSGAPTNAGTYTANITFENVDLTDGGTGDVTATVEYTIAPATLTGVSVEQSGTLTYTGEAQTPEVTTSATAVNDQTVTFTYSTTENGTYGSMPTVTNVNDCGTIYYKASAPNHGDVTGSFTVSMNKADKEAPAAPTATSTSVNSITLSSIPNGRYKLGDGEWQTSPTFSGLEMNTSYTFYQKYAEDSNYNESLPSVGADISTSNHVHEWSYQADGATITATCANTDGGHSGNTKSTLTIVAPTLTTYGGTGNATATIEGSIDGVTNPDIVYKNGDTVLAAAPTDAGSYTASVTIGGVTASIEYEIEKADAPVLSDGQKPTKNENIIYDGTEKELITGPVDSITGYTMEYAVTTTDTLPDDLAFDTSIPKETNAGTYYVWYKVIGDANHNDSDAKCIEASIAKATLTITADAKSKTAGEADPELTYTVKGLVEGDKLNGALSRVEGEEAGEYDIKQGTLSAGDNYSIVFTGAKLTIKEKKKITYTAYSGNGATWKKGSEEGLTLTFKRSEDDGTTIDHFTGITVAGKAVDKDKYSAVAGSVVITLKSEYLETLEEGEYLLAAQFDDGEDAEATFTIANADKTDYEVDEPEEEKADDAKVDEPEEEKADDAKVDEPEEEKADDAKVDEPEEEKADDAKIEEPEPEKPVQEAPADNTPKTSDNMNVPGVLFVMDLALLGMIVVMLLIGREKKKRR